MYYLIISRRCPDMQQELATTLWGRKDVQVILDRRYGQRRAGRQSTATNRRRIDRRRIPSLIPADRSPIPSKLPRRGQASPR